GGHGARAAPAGALGPRRAGRGLDLARRRRAVRARRSPARGGGARRGAARLGRLRAGAPTAAAPMSELRPAPQRATEAPVEPPGPSSRLSEGERIPGALLDEAVTGVNLMPGSLRDQLGDVPTLLVFLRHFGCVFCRETLADLRACAERDR